MRILMVGCGAVGQVLALHVVGAGHELAFYARPRSAAGLRRALGEDGLVLAQVSHFRKHPSVRRLRDYRVVEDLGGSQAFDPDQIWFTTPSPVYHSEWFRSFVSRVRADRVVCFAPEGRRPDMMPVGLPEDHFVFAGVTFVAWQGDLGVGAGPSDGVSFWLPPGVPIPLMGTATACAEVAEVLETAGLRAAGQRPGYQPVQGAVTAVMTTFVAGLELSSWSLRAFRTSPWRRRAARAAQEAVLTQLPNAGALTKRLLGIPLSSLGFGLATFLVPIILPIDAEAYLRFHFLKTRDQTLALLELFAEDGRRRVLQVSEIRALRQALLDTSPAR